MREDDSPPPLDTGHHALFLDFDGTLVDLAPTPESIKLRPGTGALLEALTKALGGALAIVSGRRIADLDRYLAPSEFSAAGVHGQEFRATPGRVQHTPPPKSLAIARRRLAEALTPDDPIRLEDKESALVLHYRLRPEQRERAKALTRAAALDLADLEVVGGHGIYEIVARAVTKGLALELFLAKPPFLGRAPVFVGDDRVDEDGLSAAAAAGGFGVKVGPGETVARYRLSDVSAVHAWLSQSIGPDRLSER